MVVALLSSEALREWLEAILVALLCIGADARVVV